MSRATGPDDLLTTGGIMHVAEQRTPKRFRSVRDGQAAEVWVDFGVFRYSVELYESGEFVGRKKGPRPSGEETEVFLSGRDFSALVRIQPDGTVRCTWSR